MRNNIKFVCKKFIDFDCRTYFDEFNFILMSIEFFTGVLEDAFL